MNWYNYRWYPHKSQFIANLKVKKFLKSNNFEKKPVVIGTPCTNIFQPFRVILLISYMLTYFKTCVIEKLLQYLSENVLNKGVKFKIYLKILKKLTTMLIVQRSQKRSQFCDRDRWFSRSRSYRDLLTKWWSRSRKKDRDRRSNDRRSLMPWNWKGVAK